MTRDTPPGAPGPPGRRQDGRRARRTAGSAVEELLGRYDARPLKLCHNLFLQVKAPCIWR
jgi:hypothetical protein